MTDLEKLMDSVEVGWKVRIIDHDLASESREDCTVTEVSSGGWVITPKNPWGSQGRKFTSVLVTLNGDVSVKGFTLSLYRTPPAHTGKPRVIARSYIFEAPR
jgi:hypothetical protein